MRQIKRTLQLLANFILLLCVVTCSEGTHVLNLKEDFGRIYNDPKLYDHAEYVIRRIESFKLPMHPRVSLFYELLKKKVEEFAQQTSDSLYNPFVFRADVANKR